MDGYQPYVAFAGIVLTAVALWFGWRVLAQKRGTSGDPRRARPPAKYATSSFKKEEKQHYADLLFRLMSERKPHLNTGLKLVDLANMLSLSSHQLSELLNETLGRSYYEFINGYRVEEAKAIMKKPAARSMTILSIAHESGFSNKASFNRVFKEATGMTPSAYRKVHSEVNLV